MLDLQYRIRPNAYDLTGHTHPHAHILLVTQEPLLVRCGGADIFVTP